VRSSRVRVLLVVAIAGAIAAGAAAAVAFHGRPPDARVYRDGNPPLTLDVFQAPAHQDELTRAADLYAAGRLAEAELAFRDILFDDPDSVEAAIGDAFARWPAGTTARLQTLAGVAPDRATVQLNLGIALFWEGRTQEALGAWREALVAEPDSSAALRAESLLHPDLAPSRPIFVTDAELPSDLAGRPVAEQLSGLLQRAENEGSARSWILYGVALQRAGRPVSAKDAYDRAVELDPDDVAAQVAQAVGAFAKEDPSAAFSRLGPLARDHPDEAVVSYHLGLLLVWLRELETAREELGKAQAADPDGFYGREAARLADALARAQQEPGVVPSTTAP
jgi:tetratricopeptide (TPR) repeat protein